PDELSYPWHAGRPDNVNHTELSYTGFGAREDSQFVPPEAGWLDTLEIPERLVDTRGAAGIDPPLESDQPLTLDLADLGIATANITSVVVNITVLADVANDTPASTDLVAWRTGAARSQSPYLTAVDNAPVA